MVVVTPTASGKTLCYNIPVLDTILTQKGSRALYLFPTKALAQDQARKLAQLRPPGLREAIYDGDTPREERPAIRRRNNLVLTNPDMLHAAILRDADAICAGDPAAESVDEVIAANPKQAEQYRGGKKTVLGFFVGQVMKAMRGKANPKVVNEILKRKLAG